MPVKFRAHSVGSLLVGGNAITDRQRERLQELLARQNDPDAKPLTARMQGELQELIAKRDADFEFGASALSYIRECWLRNVYGYDPPIVTDAIIKGWQCESEAIGVVTRQVDGPFRVKNEQQWENDWFSGTPDIVLDDAIEDVKCSFTLKTFFDVQHPSSLFFAQGQVYMDLTGRDTFRLCHVLLPTPQDMVIEDQRRVFFQFGCNEEDPNYIDCCHRIEAMHDVSAIPEDQRIKVFEFRREELYLARLRKRVEQARQIYDSLTLTGD